jgi:hypothetical protein
VFPDGLDQRFHVIQIFLERASPGVRQTILRLRHAALKRLGADDVIGILQLARMHTQVSIGGVEKFLQFVEGEARMIRSRMGS